MTHWTANDIPDQKGRLAVVTGTGGLGLEDALGLTRAGAEVIIAGRNSNKGAEAVARVRQEVPSAIVRFERLDLAELASVTAFGERLRGQTDHLDILINNAAVMVPPTRAETVDGFELQLGTNYLGHFALTAHLMPLLRKATGSRVVNISSVAASSGAIEFDDLNARRRYRSMPAYGQSKLACLMFAFELHRRSEAGGWGVASLAAHPGISRTDLLLNAPGQGSMPRFFRKTFPFLFQPAAQGALPTLFAATAPDARSGVYYGPDGGGELRGYPKEAKVPPRALDHAAARRLWAISEDLTGVSFG